MIYNSSIIIILIAGIIIYFHFRRIGFGKKALLYMALMLPVFFFSTNMLTDAVTTDEPGYMIAFSDPVSVEPGSEMWVKATNQYRITQIVECTVFRICRIIYPKLSQSTVLIAYKIIHWFMFFMVILFTSTIWSRFIIDAGRETIRYRLSNIGILYVLMGVPVSCLLLKVCNYDAGNVYFAILGLSFCIAADRQKRPCFAYVGGLIAALGTLEKFVSLMYWCLCVCFLAFLLMRECGTALDKLKRCFVAVLLSMVSSTVICLLSLLYIRFIYGRGIIDFTFKKATIPLLFEFQYFARYLKMLVTGVWDEVNDNVLFTYMVVFIFLVILSLLMSVLYHILAKKTKTGQTVIVKINSLLGIVSLLAGVVATYITKRYIYGIAVLPEDVYIPAESVNGSLLLYGAKTVIGHYVALISHEYGIVYAAYPTVMLVIIAAAYFIMKKKYSGEYVLQMVLSSSIAIILGFGIFGSLVATRYLAAQILLLGIIAVYYLGKLDFDWGKPADWVKRGIVLVTMIVYIFEMALYLPTFNCFAPLWIIRSQKFKNSFEMGITKIGESYTWGEELAIAGKMIEKTAGGDSDDITILTDYGGMWLSNPGYRIMRLKMSDNNEIPWDGDTYFVFTKFTMFRCGIPPFIMEVEPYKRIKYNGETTVWIYRAEQLVDYKDINWVGYGK